MLSRFPRSRLLQTCFLGSSCLLLALCASNAQVIYEQVHSFGYGADGGRHPAASPLVGQDGRLYGSATSGGVANAGMIYRLERDGSSSGVVHSFVGTDGNAPIGTLAQDSAGVLYGVAGPGSTGSAGVIFRVNPDGSNFSVIKELNADGSEGRDPVGGLLQASDGLLYGTTYIGGQYNAGTIFSLNPNGTGFTVLWEFGAAAEQGQRPRCLLVEGADGLLYGTTRSGGATGVGTVFRLTKFGLGYEVVHSFVRETEGVEPLAGVIEGTDGRLYGTLSGGGPSGAGTAYGLNPDGTGFAVLHSFATSEGAGILAGVCQAADGFLYLIASSGGVSGKGTVSRFKTDGTGFAKIAEFGFEADAPSVGASSIVEGPDGLLYLATLIGGDYGDGTVLRMQKDGSGVQVIKQFNASGSETIAPRGELSLGSGGWLYGIASAGGPAGLGGLFRIKTDGSGYSPLHNFGTGGDGAYPYAGVLLASDGRLYGTATSGGTAGRGTLFGLAPDGTGYRTIRSFLASPGDGAMPVGKLVEGKDGLLYGVTFSGGTSALGTVFRIQKDGSGYAVLKSFQGQPGDGSEPIGDLLQTDTGVLYGATYTGGGANVGTVFSINPDGSGYSVLQSFTVSAQSPSNPNGSLIQGSDGRLYGTSLSGGKGEGAVFSLAKDGTDLKVLVGFPEKAVGGSIRPVGKLVEDSTGRLWGLCAHGGEKGHGSLFKVQKDGSGFEVVHELMGEPLEGSIPASGLTVFANGVFYGTTTAGGGMGRGSIFQVASGATVSLQSISKPPGGAAVVEIQGVPGWICHLESTPAIQPPVWTEAVTGRIDAAGSLTLTDEAASGQSVKFYRARTVPSTLGRTQ